MEPQTRFCTSADGTRIAYTTLGDGPPIVHLPPWAAYHEWNWERPEGRVFLERLAEGRRLVGFDRRGVGASQREVDDLSLEAQVADLTTVIDSLGLERFDLLAQNDGAAIGVMYAAQHPERVSRLVLWSPNLYGGDVATPENFRALAELIRGNWSMARRAFADLIFPSGQIEWQRWTSRYFREAVSPEIAAKYIEFTANVDARSFATQVRAPTLVLHRRGNRVTPSRAARAAAALIPNARFVALEGDISTIIFEPEAALAHIKEFLDEGEEAAAEQAAPGGLVTILFTDIEASTSLRRQLGDAKAQELLRTHNTIVRDALQARGGSEIKHTGDGIMASFPSASRALDCAIAIQRAVAALVEEDPEARLRLYIGLNAGEPIAEEEDLFGTSVDLAKRICDQAQPGEILASDVVRQLAAGKDFLFSDRGDTALRGFEDPVKLWELRWRE